MAEASGENESDSSEARSSGGVESSFNWLSREARGSAYVSYTEFSQKAACAFDFGEDGYAASCNDGGKILHMSAKSEQSGIIFAQGNFDSTLYSSLARAQRTHGGQSTFGLEIPVSPEPFNMLKKTGSALRLGEMIERGSFNHRWPFNEYALISNFGLGGDDMPENDIEAQIDNEGGSIDGSGRRPWVTENEVGTCATLSFVKSGILYQILRFKVGCRWESDVSYLFPSFGRVVLEVGGLVKFQDFERSSPMHTTGHERKTTIPNFPLGLPHIVSTTGGVSLSSSWDDPSMELDIQVHRLGSCVEVEGSPIELQLHYTSERGTCYFETQGELNYDKFKGWKENDERTVTFMASFRLRDSTEVSCWPNIPTSEEIYKHIGVASSEPAAAAVMWENILAHRELSTGLTSGFSENRLIARCLEKILHVDLVPASFGRSGERRYPRVEPVLTLLHGSGRKKLDEGFIKRAENNLKARLRNTPLALVSNLFLQPRVDLEAMFWKIRFLVKAHEFLFDFAVTRLHVDAETERPSTRRSMPRVTTTSRDMYESPDFLLASNDLACMRFAAYIQSRIIKNRIELVVEYLIQALLQPNSDTPLLPEDIFAFEPNYYYAMMTLCYISKKTQQFEFAWPLASNMAHWGSVLFTRLPADKDNFNPVLKEKVLLLKWYHYGSIRELVRERLIPSSWMDGVANNAVYRLRGDAIRAAKAKIPSRAGYVADEEILDRLSFLAWPLGLEHRDSSDFCPATLASITANRIRDRDFTREINPGFLGSNDSGSTCGPWEIHALCHHSRLMVANHALKRRDGRSRDEKMNEVDKYRQKLDDFITAECSVVPSLERPSLTTRQGLLRSEATSVVGATLLAIFLKDFAFIQEGDFYVAAGDEPGRILNPGGDTQYKLYQLRSEDVSPAIDWMQFRLPSRYHPENFFNSLEETPICYRYDLLANMEIPARLRLYLSQGEVRGKGDIVPALETLIGPMFSFETVLAAISSTSISMIDLAAPKSERLDYRRRNFSHSYRICTAGMITLHANENWGGTLQGPLLPGGVFYEPPRSEEKRHEYMRVARRISNSLVDQEVQHRILQVSQMSHCYMT
ncbi:hypothetical protein IFR05_012449 [Cadophora sp. M221]|nr:hypothetical protein IFR05_012449 [Cadophora sp. M221]